MTGRCAIGCVACVGCVASLYSRSEKLFSSTTAIRRPYASYAPCAGHPISDGLSGDTAATPCRACSSPVPRRTPDVSQTWRRGGRPARRAGLASGRLAFWAPSASVPDVSHCHWCTTGLVATSGNGHYVESRVRNCLRRRDLRVSIIDRSVPRDSFGNARLTPSHFVAGRCHRVSPTSLEGCSEGRRGSYPGKPTAPHVVRDASCGRRDGLPVARDMPAVPRDSGTSLGLPGGVRR